MNRILPIPTTNAVKLAKILSNEFLFRKMMSEINLHVSLVHSFREEKIVSRVGVV